MSKARQVSKIVNATTVSGTVSTFVSSPIVPTATASNQAVNKGQVDTIVAGIVNSAPSTLDTLNELANALGNDANFSTTVTNSIATKAPKDSPTFTGTVSGVTKAHVGLGNVTNESKATMFTSPTFTGTVSGVNKTMVGLSNVDNTADASKPISTATQTSLDTKLAVTTANETLVKTKDYYALSGQINKTPRTSFFGFTETTANNLNVSASDWYFKSVPNNNTDLISNGDFSNGSSNWNINAGWTIINGAAKQTSANSGYLYTTDSLIESHKMYVVKLNVTEYTSGTLKIGDFYDNVHHDILQSINGVGEYTFYINMYTSNGTNKASSLFIQSSSFIGSIDNIRLYEATGKTVSTIGRSIKFPTAPTGTNLISNGTFDTDTGWTKGTGWTIGSGVATSLNSPHGENLSPSTLTVIAGKKYVLEFNLSVTSGALTIYCGGGLVGASIKISGYKRIEFTPVNTAILYMQADAVTNGATNFTLDNIAVFAATDLLRYDNLLLREDGTYFITQTEQNQYITMDTMLNYTSLLYSVDTGLSTGTSVTMTYDMTNECYNGSDGKKYITVGSTARLNQGAYHPVFNAYGTRPFNRNDIGGDAVTLWHNSLSKTPSNIANCFSFGVQTVGDNLVPFVPPTYGTITNGGSNTPYAGRPDLKLYDIIYNELFIDQRWKAEYIDGTKERTTKERDKDISASQYADFVGSATWETKQVGTITKTSNTRYYALNDIQVSCSGGIYDNTELFTHRNIVGYIVGSNGAVFGVRNSAITRILWSWTGSVAYLPCESASQASQFDSLFPNGTQVTLVLGFQSNLKYGSNTYLHTDIIGNPANYPQVWKDALAGGGSITGTPLLVGENGENYLTIDTVKHSKKIQTILQSQWVDSIGGSWSSVIPTSYDSTNNTTQADLDNVPARIVLFNYKAYNNNLTPIANSRVISGSAGVSDVYASNCFVSYYGMSAVANLVNKIPTSSVDRIELDMIINSLSIKKDGTNIIEPASGYKPTHPTISLGVSTSPAVKVFSYLTQSTRAKQCYVFKEMKYGADWGDDNKFNIIDNVSTTTDDNGATILIGQKARLIDGRIKE